MTFVLTATTTPGTPAALLGVDAGNAPIAVAPPSPSTEFFEIPLYWDAGTTGVKQFWRAHFGGIYSSYWLASDASGSVSTSVWKRNALIPTVAQKISGTDPMALSSAQLINSATFTSWTAGFFSVGDVFGFNIDSVTTLTKVWGGLIVSRST